MESPFSPMSKKLHHHCPLCGHEFIDEGMDVINSVNGKMMVYATCGSCGVGVIAKVSLLPQGLVGLGILTDLTREEIEQTNNTKPVSAEEVLTMKILTDKGYLEIKV
jgi:predicted RNA-binding Zn-ribbon protein involved in translation (DUF1610 family)